MVFHLFLISTFDVAFDFQHGSHLSALRIDLRMLRSRSSRRAVFVTQDGSTLVAKTALRGPPGRRTCAIIWTTLFTHLYCGRLTSSLRRRAIPSSWRSMQPLRV